MNGKLVFRNVLQGKNREKPPFVPFACGLAARAAGFGLQQMVMDAGMYSSAMEGFQALLGLDVGVVNFDAGMESEALGAEAHWCGGYDAPRVTGRNETAGIGPDEFISQTRTAAVIETVKRMSITVGREKAVACALLGPCAFVGMLKRLFAENASLQEETLVERYGPFLTKLVRTLCEQKIDAFFFREDIAGPQFMPLVSGSPSACKGLYTTLFNIVQAYNAFPVVITDRFPLESLPDLHAALKPAAVVLLGHTMDPAVLDRLRETIGDLKMSIGLPLPIQGASVDALLNAVGMLEEFVARAGWRNVFYCSDGEISHDIDLSVLLEFMEAVKER